MSPALAEEHEHCPWWQQEAVPREWWDYCLILRFHSPYSIKVTSLDYVSSRNLDWFFRHLKPAQLNGWGLDRPDANDVWSRGVPGRIWTLPESLDPICKTANCNEIDGNCSNDAVTSHRTLVTLSQVQSTSDSAFMKLIGATSMQKWQICHRVVRTWKWHRLQPCHAVVSWQQALCDAMVGRTVATRYDLHGAWKPWPRPQRFLRLCL